MYEFQILLDVAKAKAGIDNDSEIESSEDLDNLYARAAEKMQEDPSQWQQ